MDAFSLSWLCFSISLITLITLQLVGYLMLSPWLTVWLGIRLIFPRAFYKQPCVPPRSRGLSWCSSRIYDLRGLVASLPLQYIIQIHSLSHTQSGGQLFEYPQECSRSAAAHLQQQRRWNCLTPADQGCRQWNTIIYDTVSHISVKSLIPSCQTLARTAPEFTECNSNSASMRTFFFTALIGHLAGCTCCKMDFPLNQQKQPSEIQHRAPALQIIFKASVQMSSKREAKFVHFLRREKKKNVDWCHVCSKLLKPPHFQQWTDAVSSFLV